VTNYGLSVIYKRGCFVNNGHYYYATIYVLEDGMINCWGMMDKAEFIRKANSGFFTVDVPDGAALRICDQDLIVNLQKSEDNGSSFYHKWVTQDGFIGEIVGVVDSVYRDNFFKCLSKLLR
jgi:hypothetical protein